MFDFHGSAMLDIKAAGNAGVIEGYGSTFGGEPDSQGDVIVAGAYSESLKEHNVAGTMPKMFWQHRSDEPIGQWTDASEDSKGLHLKGKLNMNVQKGKEAFEFLKAGDIDGLSIGYRLQKHSVDDETGVWFLEKIQLREVSVVSIGASESAVVENIKSQKKSIELVERLKAGERLTEREFEMLLKGNFNLSNSQAERAVRLHLKGQGEPAKTANEGEEFLRALAG